MFDYETLRVIWWALIGILLIGFVITDGYDLGVGAMLPFIGKTDKQRCVMINAIAPHWDGNQVWLITAGGALFAAWPQVYATSFSSFYLAMYLVLAALWLRPIGLEYRAKLEDPKLKKLCDLGIATAGILPPILFGVAFGNLMQGIPFSLNDLLMPSYHGSFWQLLNPFALLAGVLSLSMVLLQGNAWLMLKTRGDIYLKARALCVPLGLATSLIFILGGLFAIQMDGYHIQSEINTLGQSNPLEKTVAVAQGALMSNFDTLPLLWMWPLSGCVFPLLAALFARKKIDIGVFLCSSFSILSIVVTAGVALFPFIIPSSLNPDHSLTIWDATSSELTLTVMTFVAMVMVPTILGYTAWCYRKMFGRIDEDYIDTHSNSLY